MANSNSPLISKTCLISKKCYATQSSKNVKKITIHHSAGSGNTESTVKMWESRGGVSTNYYIEKNGTIGLVVNEKDRSYASCNGTNDKQAITFEVANCKGAPNWEVSDAAVRSIINLAVDVCKRNGMPGLTWTGDSTGTLTCHYMFKATACPGPYLKALMPWIASEVTARVKGIKTGEIVIPKVSFSSTKTNTSNTTTSAGTTKASTSTNKPYTYNGVDLGPVFSPSYYADHNADVKAAFGYDANGLFYHFCTAGMGEHRIASSEFNPVYYRQNNPDVEALYKDNWKGYYAHYCLHGKAEGRRGV